MNSENSRSQCLPSQYLVADDRLQMYKIKKQAKRTPKQLFALLKDRLLEMARSQPKAKLAQVSVQNIIFPKALTFPQPNPDELTNPSVRLSDLKAHPTAKYEFYLQDYRIRISDELLTLVQPQCVYEIPEQPKFGRPNCTAANSRGAVIIGTDTGAVVLVSNLKNKVFEVVQVSESPILSVDICDTRGICSDAAGQVSFFELLPPSSKLNKLCDFKTSPCLVAKLLDEQTALLCDIEGAISRVRVKKWMLLYRTEIKPLIKEKYFFQMLRVLSSRLQSNHLKRSEYDSLIFFAAINQRCAILFSYNPSSDRLEKLYTLTNINNAPEKNTNSLEFISGPIGTVS